MSRVKLNMYTVKGTPYQLKKNVILRRNSNKTKQSFNYKYVLSKLNSIIVKIYENLSDSILSHNYRYL